jgi:hypothetical protein
MQNTALDKAKRIYNEMAALADKNGVISPDKVRQLNSEQLKYMQIFVPQHYDKEAEKVIPGTFQPLTVDDKTAIQLQNGQIKVMSVRKPIKESDGTVRYAGKFDPTMSTNITNVATNILNEQVKNASGKEINQYAPVDLSTNSDGQQAQQQEQTYMAGGKSYSKKDLLGMGYTEEQINQAIQLGNVKVKNK